MDLVNGILQLCGKICIKCDPESQRVHESVHKLTGISSFKHRNGHLNAMIIKTALKCTA